jgi:hypothetical protein
VDTDRVGAAAAELYAADPAEFTDRRKALAAAARAAGDADAAKRIGALRKPTRPAWIVNRLARADPAATVRLADLAAGLRAAARAKDGRALRELSARRGSLIDALTGQALAVAGISDPPAALREDVVATLSAALSDPDTAAAFAAGTLTRAAQWAGFGLAPPADGADADASDADGAADADAADGDAADGDAADGDAADGDAADGDAADGDAADGDGGTLLALPPREAATSATATATARVPARRSSGSHVPGKPGSRDRTVSAKPAGAGASAKAPDKPPPRRSPAPGSAAGARPQSPDPRRAQAAEEAAARRRDSFAAAERSLAAAIEAAAAADSAEDRLELTVRDLEERLTRARAELADARLRARRTEAAERKARQLLDRIQRPQ